MNGAKSLFVIGLTTIMIIMVSFTIMLSSTTAGAGARALGFNEISNGLPTDGGYNFVTFGDFNRDGEVDIAFGGENYGGGISTVGLYAYTGDGCGSWTDASANLPTDNPWGGLEMVDADGGGYIELYATDEHWGASSNSGLKAFEYGDSGWTDSALQVTTPVPAGHPNNVVAADISGSDRLDLVVTLQNGIQYFENAGGNPAAWTPLSAGLATGVEGTAAAVADMNGDGLLDIVTADYSGIEYLYIQSSPGPTWTDHSTGLSVDGITLGTAVGDINQDGYNDIVFGTRDGGMKCWLGNSGGGSGGTSFAWEDASTDLPTGGRYAQIRLFDIDADGDLDLIAPEGKSNKGIEIYLGNGNTKPGTNLAWTKASDTGLATSGNWYCASLYDINDDGSMDMATASWGTGIKAYLNTASGPAPGDETPPAKINDLAVTNATTDSVSLTWTAPGDDGDTGTASVYDLRFAEVQITGGNWNVALPIEGEKAPSDAGTTESITITGLEQNTTYYFALITADEESNWSPVSNSPSATTLGVSKPAFDVTITPEKTSIKPGENINIDIVVKSEEDSLPVPDAQVTITSDYTGLAINPASGTTDAAGTMESSITPPEVTKTTQVPIQIEVSKDGFKTSKNRITITVTPPDSANKADLQITTSDITFSQSPIKDGDAVVITAEISNVGKQDSTGFTVKFYVDGTQLGTDEDFTQLKADGSLKVDQSWVTTEGTHKIKVDVIPVDSNLEHDDTDNSAEITINVGGEETDEPDEDEGGIPFWVWLLVAVIIILVVIAMAMKMRNKPQEAEVVEDRDDRNR
jgi:hypothetical protein